MPESKPPITRIAVSEARATLPALVEFVQDGKEVVLTKHGFPVARLVSYKNRTEPGLFDADPAPFG